MTFAYISGGACLLLVLWIGYGVKRIGSISQGEVIGNRTKSALLLIDLQSVFWDNGGYSDEARQSTEKVILKEVETARAQSHQVIAVRQEWSIPSTKAVARLTMKGQAIEGSAGTELAEAFSSLPDHVIVKRVQDAFETGELDALLGQLDVGKLRIVGLDLNYCVQKSALAARSRGYEVTVVKDGTLSVSSSETAEKRMASQGVAIA
ncbi:cysteine hydrolase family protein [Sneathiella glossodoripedis]|uniref:cysteine hydrolase family protein n=1 Tax=Sneathiella glossodoripedis TaxID=418853 RepID=UPI000470CDCA|nr:cysteine hydrolase [Sneathiella glossodoripedis]